MKVKFMPQDIELEIQPDQSVMDLAHKNDIFIKSICNGVASCSECRVKIVEGEANVLPPGAKELALIGTGYFIDQRRLSCQLKCFGDLTLDLSEQLEKQKMAPKKILGNKKIDQDTSHAVSGNLIQEEQALLTEAEVIQNKPRQQHSRGQNREQSRGQGQPRNNSNQQSRQPNQQQKNRGRQQQRRR